MARDVDSRRPASLEEPTNWIVRSVGLDVRGSQKAVPAATSSATDGPIDTRPNYFPLRLVNLVWDSTCL
jgi:hypothetical protein